MPAASANDVIIICNDMFDTFTEKLDYFKGLTKSHKNLKIVLFNFPGNFIFVYLKIQFRWFDQGKLTHCSIRIHYTTTNTMQR